MILGITGTNGAGKGTVPSYLAEKQGFKHYSARAFITREIERRGILLDRTSLNEVANDLRKQFGPEYVVKCLYEKAVEEGSDAIIESVRAIGEAAFLKEQGVFVVAVDADRKTRYERITARASATDKVSFEEFCAQEDRELSQTEAYDLSILGVMKMADYTLHNDGTLYEFHQEIDEMIAELRTR